MSVAVQPSGPPTAFERLIAALEAHGSKVTGAGRQRKAQCPHHLDRDPSLSITAAESRVLINCRAGCDTDDVLADLGLMRRDLFNEPGSPRDESGAPREWTTWRDKCSCSPVANYAYTDDNGVTLYEVVRGLHKEFSQRRPDPSSRSGWRWSLGDARRVLYHLPQLLSAPGSKCVFIAEGEKDVHALEAAGEVATCNQQGASSWRDEYAESLAGRDVLIIADRDDAGREHAWRVLNSVRPVARFAWIVQAAAGKDAADHLAAGLSVPEFVWWTL